MSKPRLCCFFCHRECEVFSKNHAAPFSKVITFHKKEPFDLEAFYSSPQELPYPDHKIGNDANSARGCSLLHKQADLQQFKTRQWSVMRLAQMGCSDSTILSFFSSSTDLNCCQWNSRTTCSLSFPCVAARLLLGAERGSSAGRRQFQSQSQSACQHSRHLQRIQRVADREAEGRRRRNANRIRATAAEWRQSRGAGKMKTDVFHSAFVIQVLEDHSE